ncbi:MAG: TIM23 complex component [Candelina submexicana]|nr:MAG: TIM23 complex component [Candelina submexicana]
MLYVASSPLRSAALNCRLQPSLSPLCAYSTSSTRYNSGPQQSSRSLLLPSAPTCRSSRQWSKRNPSTTLIRLASTTPASSTTPPSSPTLPRQTPPSSHSVEIDWNEFFRLRKKRRKYNLGFSGLGAGVSTMAGMQILMAQDIESMQIMGMDPMVVMGLTTIAFAAGGWLLGPALLGPVFRIMHRKYMWAIEEKEKELYSRIKKYRVDPSSQSYSNPVPDYYGEKIGSVKDYRRWLKDQRAYNKKRQNFV